MYVNLGEREKVCSTVFFCFLAHKLNLAVRSDAVVVYDNPSERVVDTDE